MDLGYIKVAAATPDIEVGNCTYNEQQIIKIIDEANKHGAGILVLPELCITGYTCNDLFLQKTLLDGALASLNNICRYTKDKDMLVMVGLPYSYNNRLYNVAAVMFEGRILGIIPKSFIPNYSEFYEARHFAPAFEEVTFVNIGQDEHIPFGTNILFRCTNKANLVIGGEICEDLWVPNSPSINHAMAGATIIANLSASDENTGKDVYRKSIVSGKSASLYCGYIYASAGEGESTTDLVFSGHNIIAENGTVLKESQRFTTGVIYADIDLERIAAERRRMMTYGTKAQLPEYYEEEFAYKSTNKNIKQDFDYAAERFMDKAPFVPGNPDDMEKRCMEILTIQAMGLKKRLHHTNAKSAVIGISGGLDSTLALIVTVMAFDMLGKDRKDIYAVTMPGFGTTDRTYDNAVSMIKSLNATFLEINISEAVNEHFANIGHNPDIHDVTYENSQARQRTYLLMDIANEHNGMVIGTGDMSEMALGWATYNGDHMSMYAVNCSVPKTLVRYLVKYYANTCNDKQLSDILNDVLDTPVSPELIPPEDGRIVQKTEDIVGPYELHDFFLYNVLRFGYRPVKVYYMAIVAFRDIYDKNVIMKWLKNFYRRFFSQQFKRSCIPDGPKVGSVALSPRGDLRMPSDACSTLWLMELDEICSKLNIEI